MSALNTFKFRLGIKVPVWGYGTVRSRRFGLGPVVQVTGSCELMGFVYPSVLIGRFAGIQRFLVEGLGFEA